MSQPLHASRTEPGFNPLSPEFIRDPYPHYHRLRATDPVHRSALGFFAASRHDHVSSILRDKRFGKDFAGRMTRRLGKEILDEPVYRSMRHWMLQQDPPDHTRLRGLVVKAFTARRVEDMRPRIQAIVDQAIDRVAPQGRMDLIADFAYRLPVTVICEMLGIPREEHEMFHAGARASGRLLDPVPLSRAELDEANAGNLASAEYFRALFELRRRQPGDDLTTQLVRAEEEGSRLSNEELTANIILLFGAGHETTVNLIGNGLLALHRNPDQLRRLQDDPSLVANAIEEFLRYDSSVQVTGRVALEDVMVGSTAVPKGEGVLCLLGAANRDPAVYPDPDRLDVAPPQRPAAVVRRRHPLLPRRPARAHRGRGRHLHPAAPPARPDLGRRRAPRLAPHLRPARPQPSPGQLVDVRSEPAASHRRTNSVAPGARYEAPGDVPAFLQLVVLPAENSRSRLVVAGDAVPLFLGTRPFPAAAPAGRRHAEQSFHRALHATRDTRDRRQGALVGPASDGIAVLVHAPNARRTAVGTAVAVVAAGLRRRGEGCEACEDSQGQDGLVHGSPPSVLSWSMTHS